jgi:hypothetical protein
MCGEVLICRVLLNIGFGCFGSIAFSDNSFGQSEILDKRNIGRADKGTGTAFEAIHQMEFLGHGFIGF